MMTTILPLTIAIVALLMFGMAIGVVFRGRPLRGSCGGVGSSCACEDSGKETCDRRKEQLAKENGAAAAEEKSELVGLRGL